LGGSAGDAEDAVLRHAGVAQDLLGVLAQARSWARVRELRTRPAAWHRHLPDEALGGVLGQLEEANVLQVAVVDGGLERVHGGGRYVGPGEPVEPLLGGALQDGFADLAVERL